MNSSKHLQKAVTGISGFTRNREVAKALWRRIWVWPLLAALLLGGVGWWVHHAVEEAMREELAGQLTTILNADVEALAAWTADHKAFAQSLARLPALRQGVRELVAVAEQPDTSASALLKARAQADIRALLEPFLENLGYVDFVIVTPSMRIVASKNDVLVNAKLETYRRSFAEKVLGGPALVSRPFRATTPLPDAKGELKADLPTIFAAAPIKDENGQPIAVLGLRIRPEVEFTKIFQTARFGVSGETYAFSETGLLLTQSRFDSDLKRLGLLPDLPHSQSILTVEVRDPQVNMMEGGRPSKSRADQPLTKLASKAVQGGSGVVMDPYGDYRGVPSVGAYRWLPEFGFGVATEVDVAEAFRPLYVLQRAIWCLLGLLLLSAVGILAAMVVVARKQHQVEKAEKTIRQLGQYTLEEKIGSGGMGSVYRARHTFLRRPTAVKMLNPDNVTADSLARFEREVQLTSRLCHPNTIAVYDYGKTPDGTFYYAMEYLDGLNLEDLVKECGALPEGRIIPILQQICGSLAEAHAIGLIHRDIKPANIILTARAGLADFVKVLDFGLVKAATAKLTQANVTVGTPKYLSPEAVENPESVTPLSDVYAIGAVAYYLLTGTQVFVGKTVMEICMKHVRAAPDAPSMRLGQPVSEGLESLILRCLAKKPEGRPAGTKALAEALEQLEPPGSWTRVDAEAWWASFKSVKRDCPERPSTAVDVDTRPRGEPVQLAASPSETAGEVSNELP
jgi:serine/threonine protein kinase